MVNFIFGLGILFVGIGLIIWGNKLNNFMPFTIGQKFVGSGTIAYQLLGVIFILLSLFFIFGIINLFP